MPLPPLFVSQELFEYVVAQGGAVEGEEEAAVFFFQEVLFFPQMRPEADLLK